MSLFTAGLTGLQAAQTGLATAGHNIANVNTPGYVRQRVNQSPSVPEGNAPLQAGTGVTVSSITRVYNEFLTAQTRDVGSQLAYSQTLSDEINRLSTLFGDESTGIAPALNSFFGSVHDLAANPSDTTSRAAMLSKAESLVDRLQGVDEQLRSYSGQWAQVVQGAVSEVNVYSGTIADLNNKIVLAGASGHPPNELLDQRDQALKELAQRVRVSVVNQGDGSVNVFLGSGQALVVGADRFEVRTEADPANPETLRLSLDNQSGGRVSVDLSSLGGGSLSAQVVAKQRSLDPARIALGRIARVIADDFNEQHGLGVDLSGALGGPLFAVGPTKVQANAANTGGATVSATIANDNVLKASDYTLTRTSSGYSLRRMSDNTVTTYASLPQTVDGITLAVSGTPAVDDSFLIQPTIDAVDGLQVLIHDPSKLAAALPVRGNASLANLGNATIASPSVIGPTPNTNLQQPVTITFTGPGTFNVTGTGTGNPTGVAYTAGATISYNGWSTKIEGTPKAGDVFTIQANTAPAGDNRNAAALAAIGSGPVADGSSISTAYGIALAALGSAAQEAQISARSQTTLYEAAQNAESAVSGVNLDEEAADLLRYQQAYQAAAKYLQITGEMFNELVSLGR